jgi:hypothetical protein
MGAIRILEQNDKTTYESLNGRLVPKTTRCLIVEKKNIPIIKGETKIPFFAIICGSIDFLICIRAEVKHRSCLLKNLEKSLILKTLKDASTIAIQSLELQRTHIWYPINPWNSAINL